MHGPASDASQYWFRAKRYGWGWGLPCRWQGWVVLVIYLLLVFGGIPTVHLSRGSLAYIGYVAVLTAALIGICWLKGPPLRWRAGQD